MIDERNIERDTLVLEAAKRLIETRGISAMTRDAIAEEAGVAPSSVSNFGRHRISNGDHEPISYRKRIMSALMDQALAASDLHMLRVGLADRCLDAATLPADVRRAMGV